MPFVANTPEALLARTDSKKMESTCHGLTANGVPCRRAIPSGGDTPFCWQHRDQPQPKPQPHASAAPNRTSIDTLADRLGLLSVQSTAEKKPSPKRRRKKPSPPSSGLCCCLPSLPDDDEPQPRPRPSQPTPQSCAAVPAGRLKTSSSSSLIPHALPAPTVAALTSEVARPATESDEPGYIYMFWLTPTSSSPPIPLDAARSLLDHPRDARAPVSGKPMLLKIGRAANVQRRMNQWSRQCGYSIEMLRFYPYLHADTAHAATPHATPHAKKVERLVHIELAGLGLRAKLGVCQACGKEHREWFQVEASREAIGKVDEVIRRWIDWDERKR